MTDPSVGDHLRATDAHDGCGTYRVVGADDRRVTLLRVGDPDGRRVHTGETTRVERSALDAFEPADPPETGRWDVATVVYWSARAFGGELAARPLPASAGLVLALGGLAAPLPSPVGSGLVAAGSLLLAAVGSGRLRS